MVYDYSSSIVPLRPSRFTGIDAGCDPDWCAFDTLIMDTEPVSLPSSSSELSSASSASACCMRLILRTRIGSTRRSFAVKCCGEVSRCADKTEM
jgi:hypothetical protein